MLSLSVRGDIREPAEIEPGAWYRVYKDGQEVDFLKFVFIRQDPEFDVPMGYACRNRYDQLEAIQLRPFLRKYAVVPDNGVPVRPA